MLTDICSFKQVLHNAQNLARKTCRFAQIIPAIYPDSKVYGANMGFTWVMSAPDGPHVGPMKLAIGDVTLWRIILEWSFQAAITPMKHYDDVIMSEIASQITSLTIVYSTVYSDADQRKHQSSASLAFVRWIPRTNDQLRGKCFHLMTSSWMSPFACLSRNNAR